MDVISKQILAYAAAAFQSEHYQQAILYLESVVEASPADWHSRLCLGVSHRKAGGYREARHQFTHIVEHCPNPNIRQLALHELKEVLAAEDSNIEFGVFWKNQQGHDQPKAG